jgi:4-methylaminobutanoate oxidase (formaldehyde-forming)
MGSITLALAEGCGEEIQRRATMAPAFGVEVAEIILQHVKSHYEHRIIEAVNGAVYLEKQGRGDPVRALRRIDIGRSVQLE